MRFRILRPVPILHRQTPSVPGAGHPADVYAGGVRTAWLAAFRDDRRGLSILDDVDPAPDTGSASSGSCVTHVVAPSACGGEPGAGHPADVNAAGVRNASKTTPSPVGGVPGLESTERDASSSRDTNRANVNVRFQKTGSP